MNTLMSLENKPEKSEKIPKFTPLNYTISIAETLPTHNLYDY